MKKIIIALFLVLALGAGTVVSAGTFDGLPEDVARTIQLANQELNEKYGEVNYYSPENVNGLLVNADLLRSRALIVYGSPHDLDPSTGNHRYLGETRRGEKYTNTLFRHDPNPTPGLISDWDWIPEPWRSDEVKKSLKDRGEPLLKANRFNGNSELNDSIIRGLESYRQGEGATINFVRDNTPWHTYVHVLQPPTDYTWGMGRMWHQRPDGIRYLTVPMAPLKAGPPPELDLAVTALDSGVPAGEKARPGQQYTGAVVVENLSDITMDKPASVKVTHQGYEAAVKDRAGKAIQSLTLPPGESETLTFTWHGPTDTNSSTIKATINLPPDPALPETDLINNEKTVIVPVLLQNLKIEITNYPEAALPGDPVSVSARVTNQSGEMLVTRLVIKVNGKVVSDKSNFDIISYQETAANFAMPNEDVVVEFLINPDKNMPANETTWTDNAASCTIKKDVPLPAITGDINVEIMAPGRVEPFKSWTFRVKISGYLPPPGPDDPDGAIADVRLRVTGESKNIEYRLSGGTWGDVIVTNQQPVTLNKGVTISVVRGKRFEETETFTFPASSGYPGKDMIIPLHAGASWRSYSGADAKNVMIFRKLMELGTELSK